MVDQAVRDTDRFVQRLMAVQEELGLAGQTNLVVTSDHGQMDISRIINPNVMLCRLWFSYRGQRRKSNGLESILLIQRSLSSRISEES